MNVLKEFVEKISQICVAHVRGSAGAQILAEYVNFVNDSKFVKFAKYYKHYTVYCGGERGSSDMIMLADLGMKV